MTEISNYQNVFELRERNLAEAQKRKSKRKFLKGLILPVIAIAGIAGCVTYDKIRDYRARQEQQREELGKNPLRATITLCNGTNSITAYAYNNGERTNYLIKK